MTSDVFVFDEDGALKSKSWMMRNLRQENVEVEHVRNLAYRGKTIRHFAVAKRKECISGGRKNLRGVVYLVVIVVLYHEARRWEDP